MRWRLCAACVQAGLVVFATQPGLQTPRPSGITFVPTSGGGCWFVILRCQRTGPRCPLSLAAAVETMDSHRPRPVRRIWQATPHSPPTQIHNIRPGRTRTKREEIWPRDTRIHYDTHPAHYEPRIHRGFTAADETTEAENPELASHKRTEKPCRCHRLNFPRLNVSAARAADFSHPRVFVATNINAAEWRADRLFLPNSISTS